MLPSHPLWLDPPGIPLHSQSFCVTLIIMFPQQIHHLIYCFLLKNIKNVVELQRYWEYLQLHLGKKTIYSSLSLLFSFSQLLHFHIQLQTSINVLPWETFPIDFSITKQMYGLVILCPHRALTALLQIMYFDRNFAFTSLCIFNHLSYLCLRWSF